jgi:hypothetical protein
MSLAIQSSPSALRRDDPAVEAEFNWQMAKLREEDATQAAFEDTPELLPPRREDRRERELTRTESTEDRAAYDDWGIVS